MFGKIDDDDHGKRRGPAPESPFLKLAKSGKVPISGTGTIGGEPYFTPDLAFKKPPRGRFQELSNKAGKQQGNSRPGGAGQKEPRLRPFGMGGVGFALARPEMKAD